MDLQVWSEDVETTTEDLSEVSVRRDNCSNNAFENEFSSEDYDLKKETFSRKHNKGRLNLQKDYTCEQCGKEFLLASHLKTHSKVHASEKNFHCTICEGSFVDAASLRRHMMKHTGEKPYRCDECGKTFSIPNNFKKHIRTHTGEKPYVCSVCSKSFSSGSNLKTHLKSHAGERPHSCNICNKTFTLKGHLVTHYKIHYPGKIFSCHKCDRSFRVSSSLKRHLLIHDEMGCLMSFKEEISKGNIEKIQTIEHVPNCTHSGSLSNLEEHKFIDSIKSQNKAKNVPNVTTDMQDSNNDTQLHCLDTHDTRKNNYKKKFASSSEIRLLLTSPSKVSNHDKSNLNNHVVKQASTPLTTSSLLKGDMSEVEIYADNPCMIQAGNNIFEGMKQQKYICLVCERQFNTSTMLEEHLRSHNSSTQFTCKLCTTTFTEASSLGRHMRKHTI